MNRRAGTNGIQTHHEVTGKPGAPTVILSHGLAADLSMWEPQLDILSRSFSVLTYDIRGHGGSSATPGDYTLALLAQDVLALMDHLGIEQAHYVGLSLGGMIGQYMGAWHGDRLSSLTLCATTSEAPKTSWETRIREAREIGVAPLVEATVDRWITPEFKREQPELMEKMRAMVLGTSLDGYVGCAAAIRDMELAAVLGRIAVPTLVIAGEADTSTPLPILERIAHSIPGAELITVANAAHMPTLERPDLCNPALERFLLAHSSAR
jgi:3-oxoadipate enol-lactonase